MPIYLYTFNLAQDFNLGTGGGFDDAGFSYRRLFDRSVDLYWKQSSTAQKNFNFEQNVAEAYRKGINALIVEKHNFDGVELNLEHSDDNITYTAAVAPWTQDGNGQIVKEFTTVTRRYWKFYSTGTIVNPRCSEIFFSFGFEIPVASVVSPSTGEQISADWISSVGGVERGIDLGKPKKVFSYVVNLTTLFDLRACFDYLSNFSYPFYLKDHGGNFHFVKIDNIEYNWQTGDYIRARLDFSEVRG